MRDILTFKDAVLLIEKPAPSSSQMSIRFELWCKGNPLKMLRFAEFESIPNLATFIAFLKGETE